MDKRYERLLISCFPYPIATCFKKLGAGACRKPGEKRLKYILSTAEAISRLLGIIVLCECREILEEKELDLPSSLTSDFSRQFKTPGWGVWMHFTREGLKFLHDSQTPLVLPELYEFYFSNIPRESGTAEALGKLLTIRNGLGHGKINPVYDHEYESLCDETYSLLEKVLEALDFLQDYELSFVKDIEVKKRRKKYPKFIHTFDKIVGESINFDYDDESKGVVMDKGCIILQRIENGKCINLDPLLVFEEKAGAAPDVFFYNGMKRPESADYTACSHGKVFDSANCRRVAEFAEEFQLFFDIFNKKSKKEIF